MITSEQMKAARALLAWNQRQLAEAAGVSVPTIQRMESSIGNVRGNVDTLVKVVEALQRSGIELINEGAPSSFGGRGVRIRV
jgi:transcriptional regulator with XRE-family HTH domain